MDLALSSEDRRTVLRFYLSSGNRSALAKVAMLGLIRMGITADLVHAAVAGGFGVGPSGKPQTEWVTRIGELPDFDGKAETLIDALKAPQMHVRDAAQRALAGNRSDKVLAAFEEVNRREVDLLIAELHSSTGANRDDVAIALGDHNEPRVAAALQAVAPVCSWAAFNLARLPCARGASRRELGKTVRPSPWTEYSVYEVRAAIRAILGKPEYPDLPHLHAWLRQPWNHNDLDVVAKAIVCLTRFAARDMVRPQVDLFWATWDILITAGVRTDTRDSAAETLLALWHNFQLDSAFVIELIHRTTTNDEKSDRAARHTSPYHSSWRTTFNHIAKELFKASATRPLGQEERRNVLLTGLLHGDDEVQELAAESWLRYGYSLPLYEFLKRGHLSPARRKVLVHQAQDEDIWRLVARLKVPETWQGGLQFSQGAAYFVEELGERSFPALRAEYVNSPVLQRTAGPTLARTGGTHAVEVLVPMLKNRFLSVRKNAEEGIKALPTGAADALFAELVDCAELGVRRILCKQLLEWKDSRAVDYLRTRVDKGTDSDRALGLELLGSVTDGTDLERFMRHQRDLDPEASSGAARGMTERLMRLVGEGDSHSAKLLSLMILRWPAALTIVMQSHPKDVLLENLVTELPNGSEASEMLRQELRTREEARSRFSGEKPPTLRVLLSASAAGGGLRDLEPGQDVFMLHMASLTQVRPPEPIGPNASFSVLAPISVCRGCVFVVDAIVHLAGRRPNAIRRRSSEALLQRTTGPVPVEQGAVITAVVRVFGMAMQEASRAIYWNGSEGAASFAILVPADAEERDYVGELQFLVDGIPIAWTHFAFAVGQDSDMQADMTTDTTRPTTAFASYAHEDLSQVLARIQGMQKIVPDLDVFLDALSLRAGENWRDQLAAAIQKRDRLFLFWSRAAIASSWVDWEWRYAAQNKGVDSIDPVPLEPARTAPPPAELAHLHFGHWTLAVARS